MLSSQVPAGGLYVTEFGQPNMGASGAGAQALAENASTAGENPAGIVFLENKRDILATVMAIDSSIKFRVAPATTITDAAGTGAPSSGGDAGDTVPAGAFFYARKFGGDDKFGFGFAFFSVSAAIMEYEDPANFAGRYWAQKVELLTISAMPSIAYRINDRWSVSIGVPVSFGNLDMDVAVPPLINIPGNPDGQAIISDGDDTTAAINLGVMWQPTQRLRFGLIYQSELEMNFNSDLQVTLPPNAPPPVGQIETKADVTIPFAQTLRGSFASDIGDQLTILGSVAWEDWSTFDNVLISTDLGTAALPRDWDDTWHFALGLRWRTGGPWTFYTGAAYDTNPTSTDKRTPDMPMDQQIRISGGLTYATSDKFKIGGAITYADYGDAEINNSSLGNPPLGAGTLVGEYGTNRIIFAALNFNWK
jgi:long-chain fatty acid transport protein